MADSHDIVYNRLCPGGGSKLHYQYQISICIRTTEEVQKSLNIFPLSQ